MRIGIIIGALVLGILAVVGFFASYNNSAARMETAIDAQVSDNQSVLSNLTNTVLDQLGIAEQYKDSVKDVIKAGIEGRYGPNGSKALVQAFTEAYPATLDSQAFIRIQNTIEAKRDEFKNSQRMLIDKVATYKLALRSFPGNMVYGVLGYPMLDLNDQQYKPVIASSTAETYRTGIDNGLGLHKPQ